MTTRATTTTSSSKNDLQLPSQETNVPHEEEEEEEEEAKAPNKVSTTSTSTRKKKTRQLTTEERAILQDFREGPGAKDYEHVLEGITYLELSNKWDIALAYLQSQEGIDDVLKYDNNKDLQLYHNTTLESALFSEMWYVPSRIIKAICKINPSAAKVPRRCGDGDLLIHDVCFYRSKKRCVKPLVKAYPGSLLKRGRYGDLPIHRSCYLTVYNTPPEYDVIDFLIDACPESLRYTDKKGRLPLHHAAGRARSLDLITKFIKLYPEAVRQPDNDGWLPLHYCLWYNSFDLDYKIGAVVDIARLLIESYPESIFITCSFAESDENEEDVVYEKDNDDKEHDEDEDDDGEKEEYDNNEEGDDTEEDDDDTDEDYFTEEEEEYYTSEDDSDEESDDDDDEDYYTEEEEDYYTEEEEDANEEEENNDNDEEDDSDEEGDDDEEEVLFPKELVQRYGDPDTKWELITLLNRYEQQYIIGLACDVIQQHN